MTGGIVPLVVEVREKVSEGGVFWTERLLVGGEGQVLLDTTQLTGGAYDPAAQEMVYRVLTPWWALGEIGKSGNGEMRETFIWTQAQWVGVPLDEVGNGRRAVPSYREGEAQDAVDVTVDSQGSLFVASRSATSNAPKGTETRAGTSESSKATGRDAQRRPRRSVEALRKEAQRRLQLARRAGKAKPGGRTATSSKGKPRTFIKRSDSGGPSATLVLHWFPDMNVGTQACSTGGSVAGRLDVELHVDHDMFTAVEHEWTELKETPPHSGQRYVVNNLLPATMTSCTPIPGQGALTSFVADFASGLFHNGSWQVRAKYRYSVAGGGWQFAEVSITVTFDNLLLQPDATNPVVLAWDPDDPTKRQTTVRMQLTDTQVWAALVQLQVYRLDDPAQERTPLKIVNVSAPVPAALVEIEWDGTDDMGNVVERGVYAYNLVAVQEGGALDVDADIKTSDWLFIDCATDEQGNPILEAEYAGYDDNGTPEDESDDNHLYYIRRYKLREVPVPLDNDGDTWENEDPVNGIDDDGDGAVDEDPEDYQPLRNASEGWIRLYDPDLQHDPVNGKWNIANLLCIEHNTNDGLLTSTEGLQHSVKVKVPVGLMRKLGDYRFVISARDSHADREKGHRQKWALERNQATGWEIDRVRLYYRTDADTNATVRDRAYPFNNVNVRVRAIVWLKGPMVQGQRSYGAYCGMAFDQTNATNGWFNNDGHWYATGISGEPLDFLEGANSLPPRLDPNLTVDQWPRGLDAPTFTWYQLRWAADLETELTPDVHGDYYYYYPPYQTANINGWGTDDLNPPVGSRRYIVHTQARDRNNQLQTYRSYAPTPGPWASKATDQDNMVLTRTWSQNCDEPPDTAGPEEYAVRISVRDTDIDAIWAPDAHKRSYLQWLTSFLEVPYEWGGYWYGGRADNEDGGSAAYDGYGPDCSGLVSAGARWAGYNWNPWRATTSSLATSYYSTVINNPDENLEEGDILNLPGGHVVTVYWYTAGTINQQTNAVIDSCISNHKVDTHDPVNIQDKYLDRGYTARELVWHGQ